MHNNPNPSVLVKKMFGDICTKTGHFENDCVDDLNKRLDDLCRFLEYDSCICTAIFLNGGTIYIALNKDKKINSFKTFCEQLLQFFQLLIENRINSIHEIEESIKFIKLSYENNSKTSSNHIVNIREYYDQLQNGINMTVDDTNLLLVKCKLFIRFKNFIKNLNNSTNGLFEFLRNINIKYVTNSNGLHCEAAMVDYIFENNVIQSTENIYIAISKLSCP
jgi:hypothetical protein